MTTLKLGKLLLTKPQVIRRRHGTDRIHFTVVGPTPFPETGYDGTFTIEARRGYAEQWLKEALGIEDAEVIDVEAL